MSFYSIPFALFLNNSLNPIIKNEKLEYVLNSIYSSFNNTENIIATLTPNQKTLINALSTTPLPLYSRLQDTILIDSKPFAVGFNRVSIASSVRGDPSILLEYLDDDLLEYKQSLSELFELLNGRAEDFNGLLTLQNNSLTSKYVENYKNYSFDDGFFKDIYQQSPYDSGVDYSTWNGFKLLVLYLQLLRIYSVGWDFNIQLDEATETDSDLYLTEISSQFSSFLSANMDSISDDVASFFINSIFLFDNVTSQFKSNLVDQLKTDLPTISTLFDSYISGTYSDTDFIYLNNSNISLETMGYTILKQLMTKYYPNFNSYWTESIDFNTKEQEIGQTNGDQLNQYRTFFKYLEYVFFQYNLQPLFFINSHIIIYARWCEDILTSSELENIAPTLTQAKELIRGVSLDDATSLRTEIINDSFDYSESTVYELPLKLEFKNMLTSFVDSDDFQDYLIETLIPNVISALNTKYYYTNSKYYENVDGLSIFIKSILCNYLSNDILFSDYITNYGLILKDVIDNDISFNLSSSDIDTLISQEYIYADNYLTYLRNIAFSSTLSGYLANVLSNYEIST